MGRNAAGGEEASFRMLPSNQSFSTDDGAGGHVHFGLVVEKEFVASKSGADTLQVFVMSSRGARKPRVIELIAVFAADLGLVERLRSLAQKLVGIHILGLGIAGDARARGELK